MQVLIETYNDGRLVDVTRYPSYFCADVALLENRKFQQQFMKRIQQKYERRLMVNVLDLEDDDYTDRDPQEWRDRFDRFCCRTEVRRIVPDDGLTNATDCACGRDPNQCLFARCYCANMSKSDDA